MSLNFILGSSQKDHQQKLMEKFITDYQQNSDDTFYFIVPNHIKFESEIEIIKQFKNAFKPKEEIVATSNLQIFSLSRLAWYFLREDDVLNRQTLTDTKKSMIIRSILAKKRDSLKIFKGEIKHNGFIDEVISQLDELLMGQIDIEDLNNIISNLDSSFELQKMSELRLIYSDYLAFINENYLHNNLLIEKLTDFFQDDTQLINTHFYFYGFSTFKKSEFELLNLMALKSDLSVSLELDKPYVELPDATDFYYRAARTYENLYSKARAQKVTISNEYAIENRVNKDLQILEDFWVSSNSANKLIPTTSLETKNSVQIWQATDRQTELQSIATYIRQLVATQNYRYKDFLILSRDLSSYESFIRPIFDTNEVPMFLDLQSNMAQHPLKLLVDYLFAFTSNNLNHESIFQLLKLDLLRPQTAVDEDYFGSAIDLAENYSLAHGIYKKDWLDDNYFTPEVDINNIKDDDLREKTKTDFEKINFIKDYIAEIYETLNKILNNAGSKNVDVVHKLYDFLITYHVFETLRKWQKTDLENGNLLNADKPEQVVGMLNQILSEFVEIFGDELFNSEIFLQVLDSGFSQSQYSQIPSTLDAVNISELGMVQMNNRQITFILGSTSEQMPKSSQNNSLISDDERTLFSQYLREGSEFSDTSEIVNNDEPFLHNAAFISAKQRIIFTYPLISNDSQEQLSPYVQRIQEHFNIEPRVITNTPKVDDEHVLEYIGSPNSTLNYLIRLNRSLRSKNITMSKNWQTVQNLLLSDQKMANQVNRSLNYQNTVTNLDPEIAQALYGDTLDVSISQLESFYGNEYEYFLKYGLKLKKRDVFELTAANMGSFFHNNLDNFVKYLIKNNIDLSKQTSRQVQEIVKKVIESTIDEPANKLFKSTPQMKFITQELAKILQGLILSTSTQSNLLSFTPDKSEVMFGSINGASGIPGITYQLDNQKKINVRGKIDRIDKFKDNNALQIIDYKSSDKKFNYTLFNSGLQLQLTTYIQAVLNDLPQLNATSVLGAFYSRIYNPVDNAVFKEIKSKKNYQLTGIIIDDEKNIDSLIKNGLDSKNSSEIYKLRLNKDGNPASTEILTKSELNQMLNYNKQLIINAAKTIYSGEIKLNPYRVDGNKNGLQYSDYKPIFEFDAMLPENNYREIASINKKQLLDKLNQEGGDDSGN